MDQVANITSRSQEELDRLDELSLKGFLEIEETPTTGIASLPTPEAGHAPFSFVQTENTQIPLYAAEDMWFEKPIDNGASQMPGAPLMKDLDSFTEGTGKGSFDSIPAASTDEHGQLFPPVTALSLELLPCNDPTSSIQSWRENVSTVETNPGRTLTASRIKRPRSLSPTGERNTRIRSLSLTSEVGWPPHAEHLPNCADTERRPRLRPPD